MKKYECPYCGAKSLRVEQKLNNGAKVSNRHHTCSNCGKRVALKGHWVGVEPVRIQRQFYSPLAV